MKGSVNLIVKVDLVYSDNSSVDYFHTLCELFLINKVVKVTIDLYNTGESRGKETSHSLNYQKTGQDSVLAKIKREQEKAKENHVYDVLCSYFRLLRDWRTEYAPKSSEEALNPLFIQALTEIDYIDSLIDCFTSGDKEEKADIIKDESGCIAKIENIVRRFNAKSYVAEIS